MTFIQFSCYYLFAWYVLPLFRKIHKSNLLIQIIYSFWCSCRFWLADKHYIDCRYAVWSNLLNLINTVQNKSYPSREGVMSTVLVYPCSENPYLLMAATKNKNLSYKLHVIISVQISKGTYGGFINIYWMPILINFDLESIHEINCSLKYENILLLRDANPTVLWITIL